MLSNRGIERVAGTLFLLLVATVIVSIATEVEVDTDTAEFRESLQDVAGDRGRHLVGVSFALLSGLLAVGLAWSFYLVFRTHERPLALLAAFGFLAAGLVFVVEETTRFALDSLAQEFAAARGSEAHAAHAVETSARAVALVGEFAHEIAITFLGLGVLVAGILISWSEPVPRIYGWVAGLGGFLLLFHWLRFVDGDLITIARVGLVASLVFLVSTAIWLFIRGTREEPAVSGSET